MAKELPMKTFSKPRMTMRGNLISGNGHAGVSIGGAGLEPLNNRLELNKIGTDWSGLNKLGNGAEGIDIGGESGNTIYRNTIAYNGATGVAVSNEINPTTGVISVALGNRISENSIFSNAKLGIDLVKLQGFSFQYGPTLNDALDADQGPNGFQNYPTILLAKAGPLTRVRWAMNSKPNTLFRLEFFVSAGPDASGFGEGTRHLVTLFRPTNASGNMVFDLFLPAGTLPGQWLTMTATENVTGNTSEFSRAVRLS
jgi:hypothetical protein